MHEPEDPLAWQHGGDNTRPQDIPDLFNPNNEVLLPQGDGLPDPTNRLTIKLPRMPNGAGVAIPGLRRSTRRTTSLGTENSFPSGSEYHESEKSMEVDGDADAEGEDEIPSPEQKVEYTTSSRGRKVQKMIYRESEDEEAAEEDPVALDDMFAESTKAVNASQRYDIGGDDDDSDDIGPRRRSTRTRKALGDFIVSDDDQPGGNGRYSTRSRNKKPPEKAKASTSNGHSQSEAQRAARAARNKRRSAKAEEEDGGYVDDPHSPSSPDGEFDDAPHTSSDLEVEAGGDGEVDQDGGEAEQDGRPYALRQRAKINYAIPPPLEEMRPAKGPGGRGGRTGGGARTGGARPGARRGPGWSATGAELGRWMGMPAGDDSDSDYNTRTPRKPFGGVFGGGGGAVASGGAGMMPGDLAAAAGTPSNLGKIGDASLADADPLGVNQNVTFDEVGGLDDHIHSLKEMTLLPLLYPEVFQRFNVTPPRGVLFHGPPGTGKTLLARALAASCRSDGKKISFFMRKGADALSKWVGEAERQLRLLFEEARNCQPSIIFFDEIDGLAPVRSSKQDQIHASIVSTLLALMDGMDGRGQVVIIGATNRPDAIDPALRRPGRFDREFYFGLPSLQAREKILSIMTKGWDGWGDGSKGVENVQGLAKLTKGYGGADLRALCTEAALNAVQRRYPQIYKSNDRLLLKPETIEVGLRDFMISIKKLVPSSARSTSSSAAQLAPQFVPLLSETLEQVKEVIAKVLPVTKKLTALEEAEWEEESEEGALERELLSQSMETLRIYRPRVIMHGAIGMGQGYVGAAVLHHLEGYHVQSLELGTLMSDSTRTTEAAIVQLFVEAKRHSPSIIYIPSLIGWCAAISETSRSTVRAMLDTLAPTDPVLLLAIVDGSFSSLPRDVRAWFGPSRDNRVAFHSPTSLQRERFFEGLLQDIKRPPNAFADGIKRKKRVLEVLPIAPPLEPRQPTAAELALQEENDQRIITLLKYRLGPILTELKRKFKRFTKRAREEYDFEAFENAYARVETVTTTVETQMGPNGIIEIVDEQRSFEQGPNVAPNGAIPEIEQPLLDQQQQPQEQPQQQQQQQQQQQMLVPEPPILFDMDLERMHVDLYKGKYLTPHDFLDDVGRIVHNTDIMMNEDPDRLFKAQAMFTAAQVSIQEFDPGLRLECERMAPRERQRREEHKKGKDKGKGKADESAHPVGTRRSARHNGQAPELSITDPLKLERKLKRQRSNEGTGDSHGSSEENGDDRGGKRSKMSVSDDDDRDPLDLVGPDSQTRPPTVRFAPDIENMQARGNKVTPMAGQEDFEYQPPSPTPRRSMGFDSFLLNPVPPNQSTFSPGPPLPSLIDTMNRTASPLHTTPSEFQQPMEAQPIEQPIAQTPTPAPVAGPSTPTAIDPLPADHIVDAQPEPEPMIIERTPTPLPDFHVDESLLNSLQADLRDTTASLNVEQLEQLRAACLGSVWRQRAEWDRDSLVRELKSLVKEFVDEIAEDTAESPQGAQW